MKPSVRSSVVATLAIMISSCGSKESKPVPRPETLPPKAITLGTLKSRPVGAWRYEYLVPRAGLARESKMVVLTETTTVNGKTFFRVERTERDRALRAIRIHQDDGRPRIDWAIAGDRKKPSKLFVESNTILECDGTTMVLGAGKPERPFARLTRLP